MCKIIQFPTRTESNGYKNLKSLFEVCDSVESCNFYLESSEYLFNNGNISEKELLTLRRIGRQKRLDLAQPKMDQIKADKPGTYTYTPEMNQEKPYGCQMEARRAYYGKHMYIDTPMQLKGRGIKLMRTYKANELTASGQYKTGWNEYQVTNLAFEKLKNQYAISMECNLD